MSVSWENQNLIKVPHFYRANSLLIPTVSLAFPYVFSHSQKVRPFRLNSKCLSSSPGEVVYLSGASFACRTCSKCPDLRLC